MAQIAVWEIDELIARSGYLTTNFRKAKSNETIQAV
jgi:hypothetical protein